MDRPAMIRELRRIRRRPGVRHWLVVLVAAGLCALCLAALHFGWRP